MRRVFKRPGRPNCQSMAKVPAALAWYLWSRQGLPYVQVQERRPAALRAVSGPTLTCPRALAAHAPGGWVARQPAHGQDAASARARNTRRRPVEGGGGGGPAKTLVNTAPTVLATASQCFVASWLGRCVWRRASKRRPCGLVDSKTDELAMQGAPSGLAAVSWLDGPFL